MTQDNQIAALKRHITDGPARFAAIDAALRREIDDIAAGAAAVPVVTWPGIAPDAAELIRHRGCVVVRNVFPRAQATAWDRELGDYLAQNDAAGHTRARLGAERYAARWQGGAPQIFSVYWSRPQVAARQSAALAAVRAWLNRLWRWDGHFDPDADCAYADRIRRRTPGDATLGLGPHIDGGTAGRWLDAGARPYRAVLEGDPLGFDPFDAAHRLDQPLGADANACSAFRSWQGWAALTAQGPGDGTLQVVPIARAIAWVLLRPFAPDAYDASLCGAEASPALRITPEWHAPLLRALVPIPEVEPGDTVWWHPDLIHAVEARHDGSAPSNVIYIPAAPDCARNRAFLSRQLPCFESGRSPPDFPRDDMETGFAHRAGPDALTPLGRRQMGLD